jgi:hypothetical protein
MVEEGLRAVLEREGRKEPFRLRDASVGGRGLRPEVQEGGWERIVDLSYEGHGG